MPFFKEKVVTKSAQLTNSDMIVIQGETKLMGFPEFDIPYYPVTLKEALIRPVYSCINIQNIPGNCIGFGQVKYQYYY